MPATKDPSAVQILVITARANLDDWAHAFSTACPHATVYSIKDTGKYSPEEITVAIASHPPVGELAKLTNLKLIVSLARGVDPLLRDTTWDRSIPLVRLMDHSLTESMVASVLAHVLAAHRFHNDYRRLQAASTWRKIPHVFANTRTVGVLGMGDLGLAAANALAALKFDVAGWARSDHRLRPGARKEIKHFHGAEGLREILKRSNILVVLLPLTGETRGLLDKETLSLLPSGATFINLARGAVLVEEDLLELLNSGHISHAALDVFCVEPLPKDSPFWQHPRVTVIPHMGADGDPAVQAAQLEGHLKRLAAGEPLENLVDPRAGY
ncbi:hypothetical protein HDU87_008036 [Geranomyces variabilis]|uniref:D-isomer specific 2-hydroxyacid dehydrogenase NAD-binding domain-containing protein n=1 Tax=Geranomyces variabilis TaxID=109894 RepID=A0AAD5TP56_9FUNG|nr:hypothetical protein HDU87_008036 [Geranomyces variabilis]